VSALVARFPQLTRTLAHVDLRVSETPVERWTVDGVPLLAKRDDLSAPLLGGNKVRALELLLAGVAAGDTVLTVGASGSTHALAVAEYARSLGAKCEVITWPQETNAVSRATSVRLQSVARVTSANSVATAYLRAALRRSRRRITWVPAGGSVALGALGHVNAALELVAQLERDHLPMPHTIVVPLGSGGTVAGMLVGLALAGLQTKVVGVRVVPGVVANRWRVLRLARQTRALLSRLAQAALPPIDASLLVIEQGAYGGAYGRETNDGRAAAGALRAGGGPRLDGTYSAKAFGIALSRARRMPDEGVLFWLTFDGRWLADDDGPNGESDV
jgi:1-aminocyclopropane-1-carboxylate deaminase/D-cysteine desulfhydrase-like pyridoxal-dependent ACC family enzyme